MIADVARRELFEGLQLIEALIAGTHRDTPGAAACYPCEPRQRLARAGVILGRLIAVAERDAVADDLPTLGDELAEIRKYLARRIESDADAWDNLSDAGHFVGRAIVLVR